jgi:hypothetical protein
VPGSGTLGGTGGAFVLNVSCVAASSAVTTIMNAVATTRSSSLQREDVVSSERERCRHIEHVLPAEGAT